MMSPLEYLPERDATWFWLDTLCIPINPNKDLNIKQHGHKRSIAYNYHLLQVNLEEAETVRLLYPRERSHSAARTGSVMILVEAKRMSYCGGTTW